MIHGEKESSFYQTIDKNGRRVEGAFMQCVHCQRMWEYKTGSGRIRGYCYKHKGLICGQPDCIAEQKRLTGNTVDCVTVEQQNDLIRAYVMRHGYLPGDKSGIKYEVTADGKIRMVSAHLSLDNYLMTPSGIIIKK